MSPFLPGDAVSEWFTSFTNEYETNHSAYWYILKLKKEHSWCVMRECEELAQSLSLSSEEIYHAQVIGLLHDVGRFPQFVEYQTFSDVRSCNHAVRSVQVLEEANVLKGFSAYEQAVLLRAIEYHNRIALPESETDEKCNLYARILRDSDKLDIFRVVLHELAGAQHPKTIAFHLPDDGTVSEEVCQSILGGSMVRMHDMKSVNDFKLLLLGFLHDMQYPRTFRMFYEKNYVGKLAATLPPYPLVQKVITYLTDVLHAHL